MTKIKLMDILLEVSKNTLKVFHGVKGGNKKISSIKSNGLIDSTYQYGNPEWFMVSTDFESALYHASPSNDGGDVYVIEFEIPLVGGAKWEGYPFLWKAYDRAGKSKWYSLKMKIDSEFIKRIHRESNDDWVKQKGLGY